MKKLTLIALIPLFIFGCASGIMQSDMTRAITPDNEEYPDRESYIRATGLDKNPEHPVAVITAMPFKGEIERRPAFAFPCIFVVPKKGYLELCVAKALKEVIPDVTVYFEIRPDTIAVYKIEKAATRGDAILIRRSKWRD